MRDLRNVFGKSTQGNLFKSINGSDAQFWKHLRVLGHLDGSLNGWYANQTQYPNFWKTTLNSGTWVLQDGHPTKTRLSTAATANAQVYGFGSKDMGTTAGFPFNVTSTGDVIWARITLTVDSVANSQIIWGIADNTAPFSAGAVNIANGVVFYMAANGQLYARLYKASASTSQTLTGFAVADATEITLGIIIDTNDTAVFFYINDVLVYKQETLTNIPLAATNLSQLLALNPQTAATRTLDYKASVAVQEAA